MSNEAQITIEVVGGSVSFTYDGHAPAWHFQNFVLGQLDGFPWHEVVKMDVHPDHRQWVFAAIAVRLHEEYGDKFKELEWWVRAGGEDDALERQPFTPVYPIPKFLQRRD